MNLTFTFPVRTFLVNSVLVGSVSPLDLTLTCPGSTLLSAQPAAPTDSPISVNCSSVVVSAQAEMFEAILSVPVSFTRLGAVHPSSILLGLFVTSHSQAATTKVQVRASDFCLCLSLPQSLSSEQPEGFLVKRASNPPELC